VIAAGGVLWARVDEAAQQLGVTAGRVYDWKRRGLITRWYRVGRVLYVDFDQAADAELRTEESATGAPRGPAR